MQIGMSVRPGVWVCVGVLVFLSVAFEGLWEELASADATYQEPHPKAETDPRWAFQGELGYQNSRGSSTFRDLNGAVHWAYDNGIDEVKSETIYQNLVTPSKVTSDRLFSRNSYERYWGNRLWFLKMLTFEYAPLKGIIGDLHSGVGVKYDLLRNAIWKMNVSEMILSRHQWATNATHRLDWVSTLRYLVKATFSGVELGFSLYVQPALSGSNHGLIFDLFAILNPQEHLTVKVGFNYFYYKFPLNRPAPGIDATEYIRIIYRI